MVKGKTIAEIAAEHNIPVNVLYSRRHNNPDKSLEELLYPVDKKKSSTTASIESIDIPKEDPDYELKNRVQAYLDMGMTEDEIIIKLRLSY